MGIIKDHINNTQGYYVKSRVVAFLDPRKWYELHKYRKQRANRGWSERDAWGAGEYIATVTVEMLEHLRDHGMTDWDAWFVFNINEKGRGAYKNIQEVIDDIKNYLEHEKTSWTDGLESRTIVQGYNDEYTKTVWLEAEKELTDVALKHRMNKWHKENNKLYKKANKAMGFFGRHFAHFWD